MQSAFEKKEVLCRQVLDTVSTQINAKKKSINKAKTFIKDNHQEIQDHLFSLIKDKEAVNKLQSTLKKNPIVKNVMKYRDKYISHYIETLNKPQDHTKNKIYKSSPKKTSTPRQNTHTVSHLKSSMKKKTRKSTNKKTTKAKK